MKNGEQSAFPLVVKHTQHEGFDGLTKREYFAGVAMQGLMPILFLFDRPKESTEHLIKTSIEMADELLKQLDSTNPNPSRK